MKNQKFKQVSYLIKKAIGDRTVNNFAADCDIQNSEYIIDVLNGNLIDFPTEQFLSKIASGADNGMYF